jgi:uncharacterized protein YifE (UPF0438 family)
LYNRSRISSVTGHAFQELLKGAREEVNLDEGETVSVREGAREAHKAKKERRRKLGGWYREV